MLSIAYVLPAQVTHEVKASAGITFLKVVDLVSSVSDVIFFFKYDCWCHAAHKYLSGISPFVYRCWWIQKLSKRTIKWANHDGTPPLSQSPIVAPEKSFSSFGQEPFPPLKKEEREKKVGGCLSCSLFTSKSPSNYAAASAWFAWGHCCSNSHSFGGNTFRKDLFRVSLL